MLVADTNATDVASALHHDIQVMTSLLDEVAASTGLTVNRLIYSGDEVNLAKIWSGLDTLSAGANDVILFYYAGHGGRFSDTPGPWPNLYFTDGSTGNGLNLSDVFAVLTGKGARLVLVMGDTCNSLIPSSPAAPARQKIASVVETAAYRTLFVDSQAAIICSSSRPGERSYAMPEGTLFTQQFMWAMHQELAQEGATWPQVVQLAAYPRFTGDLQHPQCMIQ
jgi:hypothetical protein